MIKKIIFCCLISLADTPSTCIKGLKSTFTFCLSWRSKYGEFSILGSGCDTKIVFTFILPQHGPPHRAIHGHSAGLRVVDGGALRDGARRGLVQIAEARFE